MTMTAEARAARSVIVKVRLTEAEAAEVDAARGPAERAAWIRSAALAAARPAPQPSRSRKPRAGMPCEHRVPPGSYCRSCKRLI